MAFSDLTLFAAVKSKLAWLSQRQEVLSQNIANADTPKYHASDLKSYKFKDILRQEKVQVNMDVTEPGHLPGRRRRIRDFAEVTERKPYETSPNGNSVVLEEQMAKLNETGTKYRLVTQLYKKQLNMISLAVRGGQ